jgi:uncharacterized membrane protein YfcA
MIDLSGVLGAMPLPDATTAATVGVIFVGSIVSGLAGFGSPAICGAVLLHWLSPGQAVPLLLACGITGQLLGIAKLRQAMQWRSCARFLVGGLVGIPLGAQLLTAVDPRVFAVGFGAFLLGYSGYMLFRPRIAMQGHRPLVDVVAGFAGGVTGGAIAFPSAIPTAVCNLRGLPKLEQRGIIQPFILFMQVATCVYFAKMGSFSSASLATYAWCLPGILAGTWIGLRLFHRIDESLFRRLILLFLGASGASFVL